MGEKQAGQAEGQKKFSGAGGRSEKKIQAGKIERDENESPGDAGGGGNQGGQEAVRSSEIEDGTNNRSRTILSDKSGTKIEGQTGEKIGEKEKDFSDDRDGQPGE